MNTTLQLAELFRSALDDSRRGVVGLVDELLKSCPEQGLRLDWQGDRCRVRSLGNGSEQVLDLTLQRSQFRAILARVAALCNAHRPDSVSPYGGQGELAAGTDPVTVFHVSFANTPEEQRLQLTRAPVRT
jgi:hypothetical protein